jgi:hypothetical protein
MHPAPRLIHPLVPLVLAIAAFAGCQPREVPPSAARSSSPVQLAAPGEPSVELVIDYGDGVEKRFKQIPYQEKMTVGTAMDFAKRHPHGITYQVRGSGDSALLTRIDDLANQEETDGKNWLFRVNGKLGTKSFDAYVLSPGDVILWKFGEYESSSD